MVSSTAISMWCSFRYFRGKQRLLASPLRRIPLKYARSYYGVRMVRNPSDSTWRAAMSGSYGNFIADWIEDIDEEFVFVDVGANQGLYSLLAARRSGCRLVVSIEPNPATFSLLVQNIRLDPKRNAFVPICAAIGGTESWATMEVPMNHSGASSMRLKCEGSAESFVAPAMGGSDLLELVDRKGLSGAPIVLKVDVEGAEDLVLRELSKSGVLAMTCSLIVEVSTVTHDEADVARRIETLLHEAGFAMTSRSGPDRHFDARYDRSSEE